MIITVGLLGLLAALDPIRPVVFVLVLRTQRALANAVALLIGWVVSLTVLFLVGFVTSDVVDSSGPSARHQSRAAVLELVIALTLMILAARQWRTRNDEAAQLATPRAILRRLDGLNTRSAGLVGMLLQPRTLTIAAAIVIARDYSTVVSLLIGFGVFAFLSTAGLLGILVYHVRNPEQSQIRLSSLVARLERSGPLLFAGLMSLAGLGLFIDSVRTFIG